MKYKKTFEYSLTGNIRSSIEYINQLVQHKTVCRENKPHRSIFDNLKIHYTKANLPTQNNQHDLQFPIKSFHDP